MRHLALFFVTTCAASAAFAQVPPAMPPGMTPAETVSTAPAAPVKKIIKLGLDGRNGKGVAATAEEVAKMTGDIKESASAPGMPAPPAAMVAAPAPAPAAAEEAPKLRSDKKIRSDASIIREKREAAAKAKADAEKAKAPAAPVGGVAPAMPTM